MSETYDDGVELPEEPEGFRDWWMRWASVAGLDHLHRRDVACAAWEAATAPTTGAIEAAAREIAKFKWDDAEDRVAVVNDIAAIITKHLGGQPNAQ